MWHGGAVQLSDKALSIFVFAAYHELLSGERVTSVARHDGAGHEADPDGVAELRGLKLVNVEHDFLRFSEEAEAFLDAVLAALRREAGR